MRSPAPVAVVPCAVAPVAVAPVALPPVALAPVALAPVALAALLAFAAAPALAGQFAVPAGCTLEVTVQERSCGVAQYYRCASDAPGEQRVTYYDRDGRSSETRIDAEARWIESTTLPDGPHDVLEAEAADHASFSTLIATGRDDFDFWTVADDGERLRHIGWDRLTGETRQIGAVTLEVTQFELKTFSEAGDLVLHRRGQQSIHREHRRFYGGAETVTDWTGATEESDSTPARFAFPGQPGFGATRPEYDCEMQMVAAPPAFAPAPETPRGSPRDLHALTTSAFGADHKGV